MSTDRLERRTALSARARRVFSVDPSTRVIVGVAALGCLLVAGAVVLALTGGMPSPGTLAVRDALMIGTPIAVGLYAWHEGTHARFGRLLVLAGLVWSLAALSATTAELPYSIGRVAAWVSEVTIVYLTLAFPSGRLPGRVDRALTAATAALIGVLYIPTALLVDAFPSPTYYVTCSADCPSNALSLLSATPGWITDGVLPVREVLTVLLTALIAWRLAYRIRHATRLMRRTLTPVLVCAIIRITSLGTWIVLRRIGVIDDDSATWLAETLALSLPLISVGFLAGLLSWRLYEADALLLLARRLRATHTTEERRGAIAGVVADPSLELVYARPGGGDGWVTADGWPAELPHGDPERAVTVIQSEAGPVAALIHDAGLSEQRAFLDAVGGFALVWDENRRLAERVDSSRGELQESRARIVAAADEERRRIERDLHDGGQQRLVALRIRLQLAEEMMAKSPAGAREMLHRLAGDVDAVLEELRSLAAGVYPAALAAHGLRDAVRAASQDSAIPVHVEVRGTSRFSQEVETATYFCCLEAMQNVAKHAPAAEHVWILLELGSELRFEVRDDGPGFDVDHTARRGLDNMRDRVSALGGRFEVLSAAGVGTRVRGRFPAAPPRMGPPETPQGSRPELLLADEHRSA